MSREQQGKGGALNIGMLMTILFTVILIVVFTAFCGILAFVAPGLSKTMLTEKARNDAQIPDADRGQKIKGFGVNGMPVRCERLGGFRC